MCPDFTPHMNLKRMYPEDDADILDLVYDLNIIDKYVADTVEGHDHDGINSALINGINLKDLWDIIRKILARLDQDEAEIKAIWEFVEAFYAEFKRHQHRGVETMWVENFRNYQQNYIDLSTTLISPSQGLLTLPTNYVPSNFYYYVGIPYNLSNDPNPQNVPSTAKGEILAAALGQITPYLVIGNNLAPNPATPRFYSGTQAGILTGDKPEKYRLPLRFDFQGVKVSSHDGSKAYNYHSKDLPIMDPAQQYLPLPIGVEFTQVEYDAIASKNDIWVETAPKGKGDRVVGSDNKIAVYPFPLYDANQVLSWDKTTNTFHWLNTESNTFTRIYDSSLGPIPDNNMVGVAATFDEGNNIIYVFKTTAVKSGNGYFDIQHQLIAWDQTANTFASGKIWTSARCKRYYWPPNVICPTRLELANNKIYPIVEASHNMMQINEYTFINYYAADPTDPYYAPNYQWYPFQQIYSQAQLASSGDISYAVFNPGVLATVNSIDLSNPDWVIAGPSKIIKGAFDPAANPYSTLDGPTLDAFEGANDKVYLGKLDNRLFFYQAFLPYGSVDAFANGDYKSSNWSANHPNNAVHTLVVYDLESDTSTFLQGNIPMIVNTGGAFFNGNAYLYGGQQLVAQSYNPSTNTLTASEAGPNVIWVLIDTPGIDLPARLDPGQVATSPLQIDPATGTSSRIAVSQDASVTDPSVAGAILAMDIVACDVGLVATRGKIIKRRRGHRIRISDGRGETNKKTTFTLEDTGKARQVYMFKGPEANDPKDIIRIHIRGYATSKDNDRKSTTVASRILTTSGWSDELPLASHSGDHYTWETRASQIISPVPGELIVVVSAAFGNDKKAFKTSELFIDYVYAEVEVEMHRYTYNWSNLTGGNQAAVVLECSNPISAGNGIEAKMVKVTTTTTPGEVFAGGDLEVSPILKTMDPD